MKNFSILILLLSSFQLLSQNKIKDTLFVQYHENTELIKMIKHKGTGIRGFGILLDIYKDEKYRDSIAKRYRNRGGRAVPFYIGFTGVKNHTMNGNIDNYELTSIESISKLKTILGRGQKVFFIEKLECNSYKFHETHMTYD